ncbi:MAG: hypothetical protein PHP44_07375, partial [Kiritimatiellae bacterium]|nr:hypothetical protein [Kiritimatiellia bacterium]
MKRMGLFISLFIAGIISQVEVPAAVQLTVDAAPTNRIAINPRIYGVNIANWAADHYARLCAP